MKENHEYLGDNFQLRKDKEGSYFVSIFETTEEFEVPDNVDLVFLNELLGSLDDATNDIASNSYDEGRNDSECDEDQYQYGHDDGYAEGYSEGQFECEEL